MSGPKLSKWELKQKAAKDAEAKFEANQRLAKHRAKQKRKGAGALHEAVDEAADALAADLDKDTKVGALGWMIAHRKALIAIAVVLLAGGAIFGFCVLARHRLKSVPGQPVDQVFVAGAGTLILLDHVAVGTADSKGRPQQATAEGQRLTAIDVDTGHELAVEVSDYTKCWASSPHLVCVDKLDRVDFLDPRTLAVTRSAADLIAAAKLAKPSRRYVRDGDAVIVVLEDGRGARIDSALNVTALDTVETPFAPHESAGCATDHGFKHGTTMWLFRGGGTREKLTSDPPPPSESATPSGPALTFLEGKFLRLDPPLHPIVMHSETTDKRDNLVSYIESLAKEKWQAKLGGECRRAWVHGPLLVVATGNPAQRAIALYLTSGQSAWTFGR